MLSDNCGRVRCSELPRVSLLAWADCEAEQEVLLSRPRRQAASQAEHQLRERVSILEQRLEQLESRLAGR